MSTTTIIQKRSRAPAASPEMARMMDVKTVVDKGRSLLYHLPMRRRDELAVVVVRMCAVSSPEVGSKIGEFRLHELLREMVTYRKPTSALARIGYSADADDLKREIEEGEVPYAVTSEGKRRRPDEDEETAKLRAALEALRPSYYGGRGSLDRQRWNGQSSGYRYQRRRFY